MIKGIGQLKNDEFIENKVGKNNELWAGLHQYPKFDRINFSHDPSLMT